MTNSSLPDWAKRSEALQTFWEQSIKQAEEVGRTLGEARFEAFKKAYEETFESLKSEFVQQQLNDQNTRDS